MIAHLLPCLKRQSEGLTGSRLLNEQTFYQSFMQDITSCNKEILIECPFITIRRTSTLVPVLTRAIDRGVNITVNTRHPLEHESHMRNEADAGIMLLQGLGVDVLYTGGHHRKLAIFDCKILYEGSLNILSQAKSCEVMRRVESEVLAKQMIAFAKLDKFL